MERKKNYRKTSNINLFNINILKYRLKDFVGTNSHLGYEIKRWNPQMRPFIWGVRNGMHVLNMTVTILIFKRVLYLLPTLIKLRKYILFISENKQIDHVLRKVVLNFKQHICCNRWIGGVLTNFQRIRANLRFLNFAKIKRKFLSRKRKKIKAALSGILKLYRIPKLVIVLNAVKSKWAVNEIKSFHLLFVAIIDSSMNAMQNNFNIPGNVYGFASQIFYIKIFQNCIQNSYQREKLYFSPTLREKYNKTKIKIKLNSLSISNERERERQKKRRKV